MVRWHEDQSEDMARGTKMTVETKISQFKSLKPKYHYLSFLSKNDRRMIYLSFVLNSIDFIPISKYF
jgi:hypothetical protein